jgi:HlyD family secretion protein
VFPLPADGLGDTNGGPANAARFAVFVANDGRARQVTVALGARNGSAAWIRSGLAPGEQVIVYPPTTVRDGVRVKARKV